MSDLSALVQDAVRQTMTPERVKEAVEKHVDDLIKSSLKDSLSYYSPNGKLIKAAVEESLKVNRLDLPSYGSTVAYMLKTMIEAQVSELIAGRLKTDMAELLSLAPKTIKLSKIVEGMLEDDPEKHEVYCHVERTQYGSTWVYLDKDYVASRHLAGLPSWSVKRARSSPERSMTKTSRLPSRSADPTTLISSSGPITPAAPSSRSTKTTSAPSANTTDPFGQGAQHA